MMKNQTISTDILIIGGGPAGLALAIRYADLIQKHNDAVDKGELKAAKLPLKIMLIEKGNAMGNHSLSGAVVKPAAFRELLPDVPEKDMPFETPVTSEDVLFLASQRTFRLPFHPPYMSNHGNYVAILGKVVRWLSEIAEKKGVQVFTGFSGHELIYDNGRVVGVRTGASGIDKHGKPMANYQPSTDVHAKITILAEGTRGHLTKSLVEKFKLAENRNPQIYSLGVKEVWEIPEGNFQVGKVLHTMGYPVEFNQFGGGFIYGLSKTTVVLGLVVGLDYTDPTYDVHHAFQIYKKHPLVLNILKGGRMVRYGAKTIPEGGLLAVPKLYHDNVMIIGDSAGLMAMPSLKGVHLALRSGMLAAQVAFEAVKKNDTSSQELSSYERLFKDSAVYKELYPVRNFRQGFKRNLLWGMLHFGTQLITGGRGFSLSGKLKMDADYKHYRPIAELKGKTFLERKKGELNFDKVLTFDKELDIFYSGTKHDEEQPTHIVVPDLNVCQTCIEVYDAPCQRFCPAQVFEISADAKTGKKDLKLHPSNCVHCKTCDIKDPYENVLWLTPYGGDGPEYENM